MRLPIPKALQRRLRPFVERGEQFLREWEWTWTKAAVGGVLISFAALTTMAVIPTWWLYFADNTLGWKGRLLKTVRDIIALGWLTVVVGVFVVTLYKLQTIRRRLRGEKQAERYSGGYR